MENKNSAKLIFLYLLSFIAIACAVVIVFVFIKSSQKQRNLEVDGKIVGELEAIENQIDGYFNLKGVLPENLGELIESSNILNKDEIIHPITKKEFEYIIKDKFSYELCADFKTSNKDGQAIYLNYNERWGHGIERKCFKRTVSAKIKKDILDRKRKAEIEKEKAMRKENSGGVLILR